MKSRAMIIILLVSAALIMATPLVSVAAGPPPGKGGGGHDTGETATSNVSFPIIFSDNVKPTGWVEVTTWTYAAITDPMTECVGEDDIVPPAKVSPDILCYWGRENIGLDEVTGEPTLVGDPKLWFLQQRAPNKWQAFTTTDPDTSTPVVVTGVDFGDLLESADPLSQKQVRTEVVLLQNAALDPNFSQFIYADTFPVMAPTIPLTYFGALKMSGAVPGTDQSQAEIQGTDFFNNGTFSLSSGVIDPVSVKGYHATVYSRCARLVIQKITGADVHWSSADGYWVGSGVGNPVVNIAAYNTAANVYTAEINAGGSLIYGFNWNIKNQAEGSGKYRITFVIDGTSRCSHSNTRFVEGSSDIVNRGNINHAEIVFKGDPMLGDEGGLAYIDVNLKVTGGGGKGPNR